MECQRCGLSNAEAARFCPGCGAALGSPVNALVTERPAPPGPGGTLASIDYASVHPRTVPALQPPAVPAASSAEAFDLVSRPESMRPAAPDVAFSPRHYRPA